MKKLVFALIALIFFIGCGGASEAAPAKEFTVLSFSPSDQVKGRPPIKVSFSEAAVPKEVIGKTIPAEKHPLSFSPPVKGEGKWTDAKTFVFTPIANLPPATLFRATLREDLRNLDGARLAGKQSWEFFTEALKLIKVQQVDYNESGGAVLELTFNLPVSPFRLRGFLSLSAGNKSFSYNMMGMNPSTRIQIATSPIQEEKIFATVAEGLASDAGPLGIAKAVRHSVDITRKMEIRGAYASTNYPDKSAVYISSSLNADMAKVAGFVELSPKIPFTIESYYSGFAIAGDFKPRDRVEVTLKKGLPARDGSRLEAEFKRAFIFPDMYPTILLPAAGTFLSPAGDLKIPIETVNIEEVALELWRIYENNVPLAMTMDRYSVPRDLARRVASVKARPEGALNTPVRRAIDLRELAGDAKGVFLLTVSDKSGEYWGEAEQLVAVTDLGITARVAPTGVTVWANTILGLSPVEGASVKVYSKSNQLVAAGETDGTGIWAFSGDKPWDPQLIPAIVTVEKEGDLSYLKLDTNLLADDSFDTGGRQWAAGYDAMVFAPRGVFRPGERVDFSAIVRDGRRLPPEPFPVVYIIRSSLGREIARGTAMLSGEGMTSFRTDLAPASPTGRYWAYVCLPGEEDKPLGSTSFLVEDFVAPRLEVKLASETSSLSPGEGAEIAVESSYLFGAPASGLPFEAEYAATNAPFRPKEWRAFTFGDMEKTFEPVSEFLEGGTLDNEGKGSVSFEAPEGWDPPASVNLQFLVKVMEESGRWVPAVYRMVFHPFPFYLGIEKPAGDAVRGRETSVRVAAVTPEGDAAAVREVKASVFLVKRHYNLVRVDNQTRMQVQKELIPHAEGKVSLKEGIGTFAFTPGSWGEYVIRFTDETSGSSASSEIYAWAPFGSEDGGGSSLMDRVVIKTDKEKYAPGETALVSFRSPFPGNMLLTVDTDKELYRRAMLLEKGEVTLEIPLSDDMIPNAYVSAWVIRPVKEGETWSSHRALGTLPIPVERSEKKLSVSLEIPERVLPGETVKVKGAVRDGSGEPRKGEVSLFFVDEGILSLTAFATPDPWEHFMAKRALGLSVFDMYDLLMPLESRETPLLKPGGGAGAEMAALRMGMSPVAARSFLLLSIFAGNFPTDDSGGFETELALPEFSGKGRLMAVAASGDAFGKADANMVMAREITAELSLPRAVSPGDEFFAPLKIFSSASREKRVTVKISAEGPLSINGKREFIADLGEKRGEALFNVRLSAGPGAGTAFVSMAVEYDGETLIQEFDLPVRPGNPRIALSGSGVARGGSSTAISIPRAWFAGTEEGRLVLSDFPALDLLGPSSFLLTYPYGCLEQTVSSAWPLLVLPALAADIDPSLADKEQVKAVLDRKIRQIGAMQLYNGAFATWPGLSTAYPWGSVYAAHFLLEARKSGASVPADLIAGALSYVRSILPVMPDDASDWKLRENMTLKAYASYVLALAGEPPLGWMAHIKENNAYLRGSGAVFLAGAYSLSSKSSKPLMELGSLSPSLRERDDSTMESASRTEALKLLMWTDVDPMSATAAELAGKLIAEARKNAWNTTQNNAMGVLALGRWTEKTREARKPFKAVLTDSAGKEAASFSGGEKISLDLTKIPEGDLTLEVSGEGSAYFAWTAAGVPEEAPAPSSRGVAVSRTWRDRNKKEITRDDALERGDRIEVALRITPSAPLRDLIVTDMIPGGMEIENERLSGGADLPPSADRTYGVRAEMRDDRLLLFIDYLNEPFEYKYLIRAVSRGTFTVPPLAAEGMYAPDTGAVTGAGAVEIR